MGHSNTPLTRVALYCRVSSHTSDTDDPWASLPRQEEKLRVQAERDGCSVAHVYHEVYTGTKDSRPDFQDLMRRMEKGEVQAVYVVAFDRLTRNGDMGELEQLRRHFIRLGCDLVSPSQAWRFSDPKQDTPENRLTFRLMGSVSGYERDKIEQRLREGREKKAKAGGDYGAKTPYGYKQSFVPETGEKRFSIDEDQAQVVRRIYRLYIDGLGYKKIADELNGDGLAPPAGEMWVATHVRKVLAGWPGADGPAWLELQERIEQEFLEGDDPKAIARRLTEEGVPRPVEPRWDTSAVRYILNNAIYAGLTEYLKPRKRHVLKSKDPTVIVPSIAYPAIITVEQMEAARERLGERRSEPRRGVQGQHPLSGILRCGTCGQPCAISYSAKRSKYFLYYACLSLKDPRRTCSAPQKYPYPAANVAALAALKQVIRAKLKGSRRKLKSAAAPVENFEMAVARRELAALEQEEVNLARMLAQGTLSQETFTRTTRPIQEDMVRIRARIEQLGRGEEKRQGETQALASLLSLAEVIEEVQETDDDLRGLFERVFKAVYMDRAGRDEKDRRRVLLGVTKLQLRTDEWVEF